MTENGPAGNTPSDTEAADAMAERVALKDKLLEAAFGHAAFDGWTRRTLLNAARQLDLDRATANRLFPQGGHSLVAWIDDWADRRMLEQAPAEDLERQGVRGRIAALVRARFAVLAPHREAVRRAMLARSLPPNGWATLQSVWRTVDRIWAAAGFPIDREVGFGRYSRRATLAAVLTATALFWVEDQSPEQIETAAFLDRRIDDVMRFGRLTSGLTDFAQRFGFRPRPAA